MFIGYFDESKKNTAIDDQKSIVVSYINEHNLDVDIFSSTDFSSIMDQINSKNHTIIVANIACLGNKLEQIKDNLENLMSQKLNLISVAEEMHLKSDDDTLSEAINGINLAIKIRSSMTSTITRQALNKKREQGYKLGRDFGIKNKRYIWEGKEEEIKNKLLSGMSRLRTAKEVGISVVSLYKYLKLNPELKKMTGGVQNA